MKGSKYDTDKNGTCSAKECKNVLLIVDTRAVGHEDAAGDPAEREEDRHHLRGAHGRGCVPDDPDPSKNVPIAERPGWGKDYADPYTFFSPLFDGRTIIPTGNTNYSLVGITPAQCKKLEGQGQLQQRPERQRGPRHVREPRRRSRTSPATRTLDKKLMTQVVPWVPYLWSKVTRITSKNVTKYEFDQFATTPAYAHMAVK